MDDTEHEPDYSDDASTFGDRIASAREAIGLNQTELAQRLGVRTKTVRDWEQDRAEPRSNRLQMLAGLLNVSIMWLMRGRGDGIETGEGDMGLAAVRADLLAEIRAVREDQITLARRLSRLERKLRAI